MNVNGLGSAELLKPETVDGVKHALAGLLGVLLGAEALEEELGGATLLDALLVVTTIQWLNNSVRNRSRYT